MTTSEKYTVASRLRDRVEAKVNERRYRVLSPHERFMIGDEIINAGTKIYEQVWSSLVSKRVSNITARRMITKNGGDSINYRILEQDELLERGDIYKTSDMQIWAIVDGLSGDRVSTFGDGFEAKRPFIGLL